MLRYTLNKFLVFCLDKILFGVNIKQVGSLSKVEERRKLSESPEWIGGIVNYGERPLPIVKLWALFKLTEPRKEVLLFPRSFNHCAFLISGIRGIYELDINKKSGELYSLSYLKGFSVLQEEIVIEIALDDLLTRKHKKIIKNLKKKNEKE